MKPQDDNEQIIPVEPEAIPQLIITNSESVDEETATAPAADSDEDVTETKSHDNDSEDVSLKEMIRKTAVEEEHPNSSQFTLRKILGGDILNAKQVKAQVGVILLITVFMLVYISNRYRCQSAQIEIAQLEQELQDIQKKSLSMSSELTELTRETNVLQKLKENKDTTLKALEQPPFYIEVEE